MWKTILLIPLLISGVASCASTPPAPVVVDDECQWTRIIRPTQNDVDVISQSLVDQILRHNKLVEEHCAND